MQRIFLCPCYHLLTQPSQFFCLGCGGLDSAVTSAIARARSFEVHALSVNYGQRHAVELESAGRVSRSLGVAAHKVVDVDLRLFGGSSLTDDIGVLSDTAEEFLFLKRFMDEVVGAALQKHWGKVLLGSI